MKRIRYHFPILAFVVCFCLLSILIGCATTNPQLDSTNNNDSPSVGSTPSVNATPSSSATTPSSGTENKQYDPELAAAQIPEDMKQRMRQAFKDQYFKHSDGVRVDEIRVSRVFGVFGETVVLFVDSPDLAYADVVSEEYVNGLIFRYGSSHMMEVYKDGHFYTILEAFEDQLLSPEQVQTIHDNYYSVYPFYMVE